MKFLTPPEGKRLSFASGLLNLNIGLILLFAVLGLTLLGLVVLASASQSFSQESLSFFDRQLISLAIALFAGFSAYIVNLDKLRKYSVFIGLFAILLLIAVFIPGVGVRVNGAYRWLNFKITRCQVSECAKLALVFVLAHYLSMNQRHIRTFVKGFLIPSAMITFICLLIILEPDYGTTFLCASVGFGMLFLAGVRLKFILPSVFGFVSLFFLAVLLNPIRFKRLTSFLDVEGNRSDGAYQLWQGILAFAAGGVEGVGLGNGRQQMSFLPEAHTDFIFPIIGEELGIYFTTGVAALFLIIFLLGYSILKKVPDLFNFLLVFGSLSCIVLQAMINIAVVTGLVPTKGISLPFISYGGSNLIIMFIFVGMLLNVLRTWSKNPIVKPSEL